MTDYLPKTYQDFQASHPAVAEALDSLAVAVDGVGTLDERATQLVKLGIAVGGSSEGSARSHARRALAAGATPEDLRQVALLAITTAGFPRAIAALGWIDEVLDS